MSKVDTGWKGGQAFNLAVHDALHNDKENDAKYIYSRYVVYYKLAEIMTGSDKELIQEVIESKDFDEAMRLIDKVSEEKLK
jgi:hypothetical protein